MSFEMNVAGEPGYPVITLTDSATGCQAEIYGFGGLLNAFRVPHNGGLVNVIDGFSSVKDAMENITNGFRSSKLSPFVCRLNKGKYRFEDKEYIIQKHFLSGHAIHGLLYDAAFSINEKSSGGYASYATATLFTKYKGNDPGYPFDFEIRINWKLERGNRLTVSTTISNISQKTIPLADGWHPYFTLGGSVDDCTLQFDSDLQLEYDVELLPTGKKFTDNRFSNGTSLRGIDLDNSFELNTNTEAAKCVLENDAFKLLIEPDKSYPILQVYIPSHRNSIAIENLSGASDNFNNGMGLILLGAARVKTLSTTYTVVSKL